MNSNQANLQRVQQIQHAIEEDAKARSGNLPLIPTENVMSRAAQATLSSDLAHRYLLVDTTIWEYPNFEHLKRIEDATRDSLGRLFRTRFVDIRPLSGMNAMLVAIAAVTSPGDTLYSISPDDGGHGATRFLAEHLGLKVYHVPFDTRRLDFDINEAKELFSLAPPSVVYLDFSNILFPVSVSNLVDSLPKQTPIFFDCSQIFGLMCDPDFFDPLKEGCSAIVGSTHKTFPGPQKGIILGNNDDVMAAVRSTSDVIVSNKHMNSIAALGISALEMETFGSAYSRAVRHNARVLAAELAELSVPVLGCAERGYTETHQIWISAGAQGPSVFENMKAAGISVNSSRIPALFGEVGLRIGSTEVTRLGMGENEMREIASLFKKAYFGLARPEEIREGISGTMCSFKVPMYCFDEALGLG